MPSTPTAPSRRRLDGIQAGRAVAALLVTVFHADTLVLPLLAADAPLGAGRLFDFGYAGVHFFFVLSGFLMMFVHGDDFGRPARAWPFLRRRIVRIYPLFWVVLLAYLAAAQVLPGFGDAEDRQPGTVLASALLIPLPQDPVLAIAWTLSHEMLFYLMFAALILHRWIGLALFGLWMLGCAVTVALQEQGYPYFFLFAPHNILFLFGMVAALRHRALTPPTGRALLAAGAVWFVAAGASESFGWLIWPRNLLTLALGGASMAMVAGLASGALAVGRAMRVLGDASYALYLTHVPAIMLAGLALSKFRMADALPPLALLALLVAATLPVAVAAHLWIERPLMARAAHWLSPAPRRAMTEAA